MPDANERHIVRGEIWNINFDPQVGKEIQKIRPAVVMSIAGAGRLPLHIVVPITSGHEGFRRYFWMVELRATVSNGLSNDSFADSFQVKSISVERFLDKRGSLTEDDLERIAAAIALCVGYRP
jgi:mRNA interferase MazF